MSGLSLGHYLLWAIVGAGAAVCLLAWLRGGTAERVGSSMVVLTWAASSAIEAFVNHGTASVWLVSVPILTLDFLLSFGLLVLALRYGSLWMGAAMLAQSAQLGLHAFFIADDGQHALFFAIGSNVCCELLIATLLTATLVSWRKRVTLSHQLRQALPA